MKKVITIVLYNRPEYTKRVLEALRQCDGIGEYLILLHIEPGNPEVLDLARSIDFAEIRIRLNKEKLGLSLNTYRAWEHGFREADFIIHLEDDTVPARDCLRFLEHCAEAYRHDEKVFSATAYNRSSCRPSQYHQISRRNPYTCWIVGLWKNRWNWVKAHWSQEANIYAVPLKHYLNRFDLCEIYPLLSRAQNIGVENGTHVPSREWHRANQHTEYWAGEHDLRPGKYFEAGPLVTAVMVTGLHAARYSLARIAIDCFKKQTYPNKELLIINHGSESLFDGDRRLRELRLKKNKMDTVGDLRNLGLKYAEGDFLINWDDDDWYHPKRIEIQMAAQTGDAAVFLKNRIHYSFENGCALYNIDPSGAEATILHPAQTGFCYPSLVRNSDAVFSKHFKKRIALDNDPELYVRFYHGLNLWDQQHIMRHLAAPKSRHQLQVNPEHQRLLTRILPSYKDWSLRNETDGQTGRRQKTRPA